MEHSIVISSYYYIFSIFRKSSGTQEISSINLLLGIILLNINTDYKQDKGTSKKDTVNFIY